MRREEEADEGRYKTLGYVSHTYIVNEKIKTKNVSTFSYNSCSEDILHLTFI